MLPTFQLFSTEQDTDQLTTLVKLYLFRTIKNIQGEVEKVIISCKELLYNCAIYQNNLCSDQIGHISVSVLSIFT